VHLERSLRNDSRQSAVRLYVRLRRGASQGALLSEWQAPHRELKILTPHIFQPSETPEVYRPATSAPRASKTGLRRLLFGYSCLLLVCAGATIASLQAARALVRQREIEIRFALGAQQRHVISQWLTENALLAAFGATGAIAIGRLAREALRRWSASTPDLQFTGDTQSTVAAVVLASAASLFFGVLPTLRRARAGYRPVKRRRGLLGFQSGVSCFFCRHRRHSHAVGLAPIGAAGCLSN